MTAVFEAQLKERGWGIEHAQEGTPHWRANLLWTSKLVTPGPEAGEHTTPPRVIVAAMGPIGHIYAPEEVSEEARSQLAEALVREAKIPIVMAAAGAGQARAWTAEGTFALPKEASQVVGKDHPYLSEVAEDLVSLCHHPDAGTFVISAWRAGNPSTFPMEFGSHAGPGHEETNGFAHLPADVLTLPKDRAYVRNADLRAAAQRVLKHTS